jgi:hypothetical protein
VGERREHEPHDGVPRDDRPADAVAESGLESDFDYDLSLVHSDDEYLDLLGGANLDDPDGVPDDQLSALLLAWRQDVDSEPIGELVDEKLATVTVQAARLRRRRRPRMLVPVAAAAAVLAIAFAGVGLAAQNAQPGDTLWALTKVLYADHARSVEAAEAVRTDLRDAEEALTEGDVAQAKSKLEAALTALPTVSSEDGHSDLEAQHATLLAQLPGNPSGEASQPPQPNPTTAPDSGSGTGGGSDPTSPSNPPDTSSQSTPPEGTTSPTTPSNPPTSTSSERTETSTNSVEGLPPAGEEPAAPAAPGAEAPTP